jgi:hypothetical protein
MTDFDTPSATAPGLSQTGETPPHIYPATSDTTNRSPWRLTVVAIVLTLVIGALGGGWAALRFLQDADRAPAAIVTAPPPAPAMAATAAAAQAAAVAQPPMSAQDAGAIAARVSMLEERLSRISLAADSASGNAARAEALLIAFAARRAIERGFPLGSMEAQLRLRFGDTQPNAVNSILSASTNPVTSEQLLVRLDALRPTLMIDQSAGWLTRLGRGIGSLVVIRSADQPSSRPAARYDAARRAVMAGRVDDAIAEVESLLGHDDPMAAAWLTDARRYNDARRALDLIETAAILEPGQNRAPDTAAAAPAPTPAPKAQPAP